MKISVIVPAYNAEETIGGLIAHLQKQTFSDFETIIVDDCSMDNTLKKVKNLCRLIKLKENVGPAVARNIGVAHAKGDVLAFIDSDCRPSFDWVEQIHGLFQGNDISVAMGKIRVQSESFTSDCISALGFPAGGSLGFEKMWPVNEEGFTNSLSSCNFAIRKKVFQNLRGFDEDFKIYCEDSEFAFRLIKSGYKIKYCPELIVFHEPMTRISEFLKNHLKRGEGNFIFKKKIGNVENYIKMRLWSSKNIIKANSNNFKLPMILLLLALSFGCQQIGYLRKSLAEEHENRIRRNPGK